MFEKLVLDTTNRLFYTKSARIDDITTVWGDQLLTSEKKEFSSVYIRRHLSAPFDREQTLSFMRSRVD